MAKKKRKKATRTRPNFSIRKRRGKNILDVNIPKDWTEAMTKKAINAKMKRYRPALKDDTVRINVFRTRRGKVIVRTILWEFNDIGSRDELAESLHDSVYVIFHLRKNGESP